MISKCEHLTITNKTREIQLIQLITNTASSNQSKILQLIIIIIIIIIIIQPSTKDITNNFRCPAFQFLSSTFASCAGGGRKGHYI